MNFIKTLGLFVLSLYTSAGFANFSFSQQMQNFVNTWRIQNQVPAVVLSIRMPDGQIADFMSGSSTLNGNTPITLNNLFGVGSITKTFIAGALLQLQEEGKVKLDDTIGVYFPEYPRWSHISIRELLNMTSGIVNYSTTDDFNALLAKNMHTLHSPSQLIAMAYQEADYFAPGKGWHYSNTNYLLLGLIIEKVSHQPLAQVLQTRFFIPLKLKHTFYSDTQYASLVRQQMAHSYFNDSDDTDASPSILGPAGSMLMNSHDLIIWVHALFTRGRVLTASSIKELTTTIKAPSSPPKPDGAAYGLGIYSLDVPNLGRVWWYTGVSFQGYSSVFMWIPSKEVIIVAQINRWQGNNYGLLMPGQAFMQGVLAILFPKS